ncbi:hypothetical protein V9I39_004797, partial [Salmonella enterica]|nr:hypothetical protein [Salmonella enterica]EME9516010.1 hypothetical protein [Salmonella enterica]
KAVNQFAVLRLRNRLRICRLDGVNGHQGHSRGGKAVILSDRLVKANDCERIFLIFKKDKCTFLYNFLPFSA